MGQVVSFIVPSGVLAGRKFEEPIEQDTLCTAELVWTLGRREKSLACGGNEATIPWMYSLYPNCYTSYTILAHGASYCETENVV
jgi:hypothetical protein